MDPRARECRPSFVNKISVLEENLKSWGAFAAPLYSSGHSVEAHIEEITMKRTFFHVVGMAASFALVVAVGTACMTDSDAEDPATKNVRDIPPVDQAMFPKSKKSNKTESAQKDQPTKIVKIPKKKRTVASSKSAKAANPPKTIQAEVVAKKNVKATNSKRSKNRRVVRSSAKSRTKRIVKTPNASSKTVERPVVKRKMIVMSRILNVREKPSLYGDVTGKLVRGSTLTVEIQGDWGLIGKNQYIHTRYLKPVNYRSTNKNVALGR